MPSVHIKICDHLSAQYIILGKCYPSKLYSPFGVALLLREVRSMYWMLNVKCYNAKI